MGVTAAQLKAIAAKAGHPIYWAGPFSGTYELTTIADGRTYIRYLSGGAQPGNPHKFLTIGTYTRPAPPYGAVRRAALAKHAAIRPLKGGGLAVAYNTNPQSVYLVFPGAHYEVEVYDPLAPKAMRLASTGKIVPIP